MAVLGRMLLSARNLKLIEVSNRATLVYERRFLFMAFPFLQKRIDVSASAWQLKLSSYDPVFAIDGIQTGIDNIRSDVYLSPRLSDSTRAHLSKLIARFGGIEEYLLEKPIQSPVRVNQRTEVKPDAPDFVAVLGELQLSSLNRAKSQGNISIDRLARLALIKFLRSEMTTQYNTALERLRTKLKTFEGPHQQNATATIRLRERIAKFQLEKKSILRKVGQELYQTLLELDKGTVALMRRSLFGDAEESSYELLHNRLLFAESPRDDLLNAEQYVILGNYERDPDRLGPVVQMGRTFLAITGLADEDDETAVNALLSVPENADELLGGGCPDDATDKGKLQQQLLGVWINILEKEGIINHAIASYEVPGLLGEYSPINPQQLKHALISREERKRVCVFLEQHGRISEDRLYEAALRVAGCKGSDRSRVAARYLRDVLRYYRDMRRFDVVISALDGVNLIGNEKLRELSAINHTLYEFLLPVEQKPSESKVLSHIVLKADIRDSSVLTRTLFERGLNPASYFSLNFYEPVNKLLDKYCATKLFIEGDAVILALFEREGEPPFGVSRTCVLAREMIEIVRGYNQKSEEAGLPTLELGIGICYQDSAPMYLMDGTSQIMISPALNESDRLSSCSRSARKLFAGVDSLFNVFCFQTIDDADTAGQPEEFLMRFNIGGINLQEAAFHKLAQEISLQAFDAPLPALWDENTVRLYSGVVPVGTGMFHNLVVRESKIAHVDARDFHLKHWTDRHYYEVCTNEEIYDYLATNEKAVAAE